MHSLRKGFMCCCYRIMPHSVDDTSSNFLAGTVIYGRVAAAHMAMLAISVKCAPTQSCFTSRNGSSISSAGGFAKLTWKQAKYLGSSAVTAAC